MVTFNPVRLLSGHTQMKKAILALVAVTLLVAATATMNNANSGNSQGTINAAIESPQPSLSALCFSDEGAAPVSICTGMGTLNQINAIGGNEGTISEKTSTEAKIGTGSGYKAKEYGTVIHRSPTGALVFVANTGPAATQLG